MKNKQLKHQRTNNNYKQNREKGKKGAIEMGKDGRKKSLMGKKKKTNHFDKIIMSSKDKFT